MPNVRQSVRTMQGQAIPCPICKTSIPFSPEALLRGSSFSCTKCNSQIGLASTETPLVNGAIDKLNSLSNKTN